MNPQKKIYCSKSNLPLIEDPGDFYFQPCWLLILDFNICGILQYYPLKVSIQSGSPMVLILALNIASYHTVILSWASGSAFLGLLSSNLVLLHSNRQQSYENNYDIMVAI